MLKSQLTAEDGRKFDKALSGTTDPILKRRLRVLKLLCIGVTVTRAIANVGGVRRRELDSALRRYLLDRSISSLSDPVKLHDGRSCLQIDTTKLLEVLRLDSYQCTGLDRWTAMSIADYLCKRDGMSVSHPTVRNRLQLAGFRWDRVKRRWLLKGRDVRLVRPSQRPQASLEYLRLKIKLPRGFEKTGIVLPSAKGLVVLRSIHAAGGETTFQNLLEYPEVGVKTSYLTQLLHGLRDSGWIAARQDPKRGRFGHSLNWWTLLHFGARTLELIEPWAESLYGEPGDPRPVIGYQDTLILSLLSAATAGLHPSEIRHAFVNDFALPDAPTKCQSLVDAGFLEMGVRPDVVRQKFFRITQRGNDFLALVGALCRAKVDPKAKSAHVTRRRPRPDSEPTTTAGRILPLYELLPRELDLDVMRLLASERQLDGQGWSNRRLTRRLHWLRERGLVVGEGDPQALDGKGWRLTPHGKRVEALCGRARDVLFTAGRLPLDPCVTVLQILGQGQRSMRGQRILEASQGRLNPRNIYSQLHLMERQGYLTRAVPSKCAPHPPYRLTPRGRSATAAIQQLMPIADEINRRMNNGSRTEPSR